MGYQHLPQVQSTVLFLSLRLKLAPTRGSAVNKSGVLYKVNLNSSWIC